MENRYNSGFTSEYNEASFQIMRLNEIWVACRRSREKGNLESVRWILDSAELELCNDVKRVDGSNNEGFGFKLKEVNKKIEDCLKVSSKTEDIKKKFSDYYAALKEKESLLREVQEAAGKGTKLKSSDEDEM